MISTVLNERYRLDAELGRGGMGVVYRAHDTLLERDVALKVLSKADLGTEGRARLLHEARAAAQLNHPNIVSIYDAGEVEGTSFIVMELVEAPTLFEHRPGSLDEILSVAQQICDALEHAHAHGIVHRDLKPENVIITGGQAKLTDFGLARSMTSRMSTEGAISGTVFYLPPEQALGQEVDGRADLYALGVMLYELATGQLPFSGDDPLAVISQHLYAPVVPPRTHNADIPPALDALIVQLLSKQPQDRPASAADVRQALQTVVTASAVPSSPSTPSPLDQLVRGRLVGREREMAEARALWMQAAAASEGRNVLLISGEAGVGKTPLVRELKALARVSGGQALTGECYAGGSAPYTPIAQIIREALPLLKVDLPDLVLAGLIALAPDLQARYPDVPPNPPLTPQAEQQRLFESVVALCAALTERAPLLLTVEDVQWADGGTLFLLRHLARRGRSSRFRLLVVMTYREMELDQSCCLSDVLLDFNRERLSARIKLGRLDREQTRDLLSVMLQDEITPEFLDGIYRETEGNPFFVEEVCKALIEEGKLYRDNGRWRRPDMSDIQLPQSVRMVIQARVGRLPSQAQDALRLAAIIGREFDFDTLRRAGELDEEALVDALEVAEQAQLIAEVKSERQDVFAFAHRLTMTTLRESVSGLRRRRLHHRVASVIEALRPDDLEALVYHYAQAGAEACALTYSMRAAYRARQVYANEEAIRFYSEALELMPDDHPAHFDVLAARVEVYDIVARREAQHVDVQAMLALAERLDDDARRCDALIALADFYAETEPFHAREPAERAVTLAQALDDPVREGHALRRVGYDAWHRSDYPSSRDALQAAAARFQEAGLPGEAAACLHTLSLALGSQGENATALEAAKEALALSRQAGDQRREATSLRRLAIVHMNTGQYVQALPNAEDALALHHALGDRSEECNALNVVGIIHAWLGRPEVAKDYLDRSLELAEHIGSSTGISNAVSNLLWVHFEWQGELEAGLAFIEQRLEKARLSGDAFLIWRTQGSKIQMLARLGQYARALELAQTALSTIEDLLGHPVQTKYLADASGWWAELGDYDRARQELKTLLERAEEAEKTVEMALVLLQWAYVDFLQGQGADLHHGLERAKRTVELLKDTDLVSEPADALALMAWFQLALGQKDDALISSTAAVEQAAKLPIGPEHVFLAHSRVLRAVGREAESDDYLRRAHERVMLVASKTRDEDLRRGWLENVRVNREILADWAARETEQ
jgi:tetratricopeptide (TPR) repeat protein